MSTTNTRQLPKAQESLADYVNRQREALGLTRIALAERAGIHKQSLGKIERGQTQTLNRRTLSSLSKALEVPIDYLDAVTRGQTGTLGPSLKFCPQCWQAGTAPDPIWTDARSQFLLHVWQRLARRLWRLRRAAALIDLSVLSSLRSTL